MPYQTVNLAVVDRVATISINRPERLNALTPYVIEELVAALDEAVAGGARAIVLTGAGRAFCSGADLLADGEMPYPDIGALLRAVYNPVVSKLAGMEIPILTAVNGPAAGAGVGLALLGDIVVMARSAYLLLAFVNVGLVPDFGATWLVAKGAGRAKALEMALLGERLPADQALGAGLVTRVVDDEDCLAETQKLAARLAHGPSVTLGLIRRQVAAALTSTLDETLALESINQADAGRTTDHAEAMRAFGEKRKPEFTGR